VHVDSNNTQPPGEVTRLLQRWADGDSTALEALWPMVYGDVRRLARRQMAGEREPGCDVSSQDRNR